MCVTVEPMFSSSNKKRIIIIITSLISRKIVTDVFFAIQVDCFTLQTLTALTTTGWQSSRCGGSGCSASTIGIGKAINDK